MIQTTILHFTFEGWEDVHEQVYGNKQQIDLRYLDIFESLKMPKKSKGRTQTLTMEQLVSARLARWFQSIHCPFHAIDKARLCLGWLDWGLIVLYDGLRYITDHWIGHQVVIAVNQSEISQMNLLDKAKCVLSMDS